MGYVALWGQVEVEGASRSDGLHQQFSSADLEPNLYPTTLKVDMSHIRTPFHQVEEDRLPDDPPFETRLVLFKRCAGGSAPHNWKALLSPIYGSQPE